MNPMAVLRDHRVEVTVTQVVVVLRDPRLVALLEVSQEVVVVVEAIQVAAAFRAVLRDHREVAVMVEEGAAAGLLGVLEIHLLGGITDLPNLRNPSTRHSRECSPTPRERLGTLLKLFINNLSKLLAQTGLISNLRIHSMARTPLNSELSWLSAYCTSPNGNRTFPEITTKSCT
jgi:hypothetical protein